MSFGEGLATAGSRGLGTGCLATGGSRYWGV